MKQIYFTLAFLGCITVKSQQFTENAFPQNYYYSASAVADFNNDGYPDIFFTGAIDTVGDGNAHLTYNEFYRNMLGQSFSTYQTVDPEYALHSSDVKPIDIDRDGLVDFITTGLSYNDIVHYKNFVFRNTGSGFEIVQTHPGKIYGGIEIFDFDHDGEPDYALNGTQLLHDNFVNDITFYRNTGGTFTETQSWLPGSQNGDFKIIDLNNDNELDAIVFGIDADGNENFTVYLNENGTFKQSQQLPNFIYRALGFADFNADGYLDFVVSGQSADNDYEAKIMYYENDGTGHFTSTEIDGDGVQNASVATADFNNDGYYDFILKGEDDNYNSLTEIYLYNPEQNTFETAENTGLYPLGSGGNVTVADFNGDLLPDVLESGFDWNDTGESMTRLFINTTATANERPVAPVHLENHEENGKLYFSWTGASDDKTPENILQYELSAGSEAGKSDIAKYIITGKSWYLKTENLPQKIFWSIKSIDAARAYSETSETQEYSILSTTENKYADVQIYPNPATDILTVKTSQKLVSVDVYSILGQKLSSNSGKNISVKHLPKGIYVLRIVTDSGVSIRKFIKE